MEIPHNLRTAIDSEAVLNPEELRELRSPQVSTPPRIIYPVVLQQDYHFDVPYENKRKGGKHENNHKR